MKQVKGTILTMAVKSIRANKNKRDEFDRILTDNTKEFLNQRILSSSWYPYEVYKELFNALCFVEARNDPNIIRQWGQIESNRLMSTVYQFSVIKGDLQQATERYIRFHRMIFNFSEVIPELISDNKIIFSYRDFDANWENFYHVAVGYIQGFIEMCIDKKPDFNFLQKSWKGQGQTKIMFTWSL
ncbi:MAG: hypothetical protein ACFE8B_16640 [Candidatus Hermodarchaeota archaeon]